MRRVPPGRAGRLWLQHRLAVARRGAELLDHKLRILRVEAQRLSLVAETTSAEWVQAHDEATRWLLRAALLGGERAVRLATDGGGTEVEVSWTWTIGVRHPSGATCTRTAPRRDDPPEVSAAVVGARAAHRRALDAAVQHAAAQAALRLVRAEEVATRRRLRAINERWLPQLESALRSADLGLEEQERADDVRLRWARSTGTERWISPSPPAPAGGA